MKAFTKFQGTIVPIMNDNIDTDQLIPKQYLKSTEKTGFGKYLFDEWRYNEDGSDNLNFNLNKAEYKKGTILITGENFGCGSSREHAAWALQDYGFHVIVAGGYSGIFYMNWLNNGHLPITLPKEDRDELSKLSGDTVITVDLENNKLSANGKDYFFNLEETWKERLLKGLDSIGLTLQYEDKIKEFEKSQENYTLDDVKKKTQEFKELFVWLDINSKEDSKKIKDILESIKAEAFALVKTTAKLLYGKEFELRDGRIMTWNMIHYDVQFIWGLAIHEGAIAEMKTWEWKTLVATLPAYLNALTGYSVHIVTVNDYLANRDWAEMWVLYDALGLTTGVVYWNQPRTDKKEAYGCDIVYATNNELWFDYLRDNMVISKEDKFQKHLFFAIIDEVDSILIDEARTPLIISMPDDEPTSKYMQFAALANHLQKWVHYKIDEKQKTATLTEEWIQKVEELLRIDNIYISEHYNDIHHIENALKAMASYQRDKDYLVLDWEVQIIDEHTWRVLDWRRYSDWLHQAIEAKEWVEIKQESRTLASITFQNFFRMYWKLAWMTWTAKTEEEEFYKIY